MKLTRYSKNPVISPNPNNDWESLVTTNPAAWYNQDTREVIMLYRAAGNDAEHRIHLGLATSNDGYTFTRMSDKPVVSPSSDGFDAGCLEDPRIVKIGDWYYITYATRAFPPGQYWVKDGSSKYKRPVCPSEFPMALRENFTATGLMLTRDFKSFIRAGRLTDPLLDDRDVIIFPEKVNGKFITLHRPMQWKGAAYGTEHPAMWIAESDDLLEPKRMKLFATGVAGWEKKIGGSTPPIKTKDGWLLLYHAVGDDKKYRIGAMLLDLADPSRIIARTKDWIYQPEADYETKGIYNGVVFPCGNVVIDGTLFVYYGGADIYGCVATADLDDLVAFVKSTPV
ncbi:MAG: glycosidase [Spirochaetes bacterium]|nr:glycosidase [Spirochaetota bacterium]